MEYVLYGGFPTNGYWQHIISLRILTSDLHKQDHAGSNHQLGSAGLLVAGDIRVSMLWCRNDACVNATIRPGPSWDYLSRISPTS